MVKKSQEGKATKNEEPRSQEVKKLDEVFKSIQGITNKAKEK